MGLLFSWQVAEVHKGQVDTCDASESLSQGLALPPTFHWPKQIARPRSASEEQVHPPRTRPRTERKSCSLRVDMTRVHGNKEDFEPFIKRSRLPLTGIAGYCQNPHVGVCSCKRNTQRRPAPNTHFLWEPGSLRRRRG